MEAAYIKEGKCNETKRMLQAVGLEPKSNNAIGLLTLEKCELGLKISIEAELLLDIREKS